MNNYTEIWDIVLEKMKKEFSDSFINLWYSELKIAALTDDRAILTIKSTFKCNMLKVKHLNTLRKYLSSVLGYDVEPVVLDSTNGQPDFSIYTGETVTMEPDTDDQIKAPAVHIRPEEERPAKKDDEPFDPDAPIGNSLITAETRGRFTFDNFLVGGSNKFAHAAALAVANGPDFSYNPLFIYGASGLGKTHLLYAITNRILDNDPDANVIYVTGENFMNRMIKSIETHTSDRFRDKFRNCRALLIDDIQFIAGKVQTQEEFFHTFNALHDEGKQIILTSDRPPKDINPLEDRLRTRFEWGLLADIQPPNLELRIAIMKDKANKMGIDIPDQVFIYLAENLKNNVRQLEGALRKISAKSMLENVPVTFDLAKESVSDMIRGTPPVAVTINRVMSVVAQKYGVTQDDLKSKKRSSHIVSARHICVYLIHKLTDMTLSRIGTLFGRDHTTILNSIKNVENEINNNSAYESEITELIEEINDISSESSQNKR